VQPCRVDEGGGRVLDVVGDDCVAGGSGVGHGCSLGDELADQGHIRAWPRGAGSLVDFLIEIDERVAELCSKFVREHCIEFLENRHLVLKCAAMRGVDKKWHWTMLKACFKDQQVL
jgi:hypothetical protein